MNRLTLVTAALLLGLTPAMAQTTSADTAATDSGGQMGVTNEADFLRLATSSNLLEIKTSEMARDMAQSDEVKAFAEQMITDHTAATQELAKVAGTEAPDPAGDVTAMLDPKHAEEMAKLQSAQGAAFDQAYAQLQVKAHEEAVALFQSYATNGQEGPVKQFAEATLPKLQDHLTKAQALPQGQ